MSYHRERSQGVGAISAAAPPPRSAPGAVVRYRGALGAIARPGITTTVGCSVVDVNGVCIKGLDTRAPTVSGGGLTTTRPRVPTTPTTTISGVISKYLPSILGGGALQTATPMPTAPTMQPLNPATSFTPTAPAAPLPLPLQPSYQPLPVSKAPSAYTPPTTPIPLPRPPLGPTIEMPFDETAEPVTPAAIAASSNKRTLLAIGGVAVVAAYLLYRRRRRKP